MLTKEISATLSDKNKAEIKQAITTIQDNLAFLISLTPEERRKRPKMGKKKSRLCARQCHRYPNKP